VPSHFFSFLLGGQRGNLPLEGRCSHARRCAKRTNCLVPFGVIERTSIRWYDEMMRKYAEGVTGLKPRPPSQAPARLGPSGIE